MARIQRSAGIEYSRHVIENRPEDKSVLVANDYLADVANGSTSSTSTHVFGSNATIASASTEDISYAGTINWIQTAVALRIKSGGNANDTASGTGARSITIVGLDENFAEQSEDVDTAGASASAATTVTFTRVLRAYVKESGTYSGANTADIVIETTGGTSITTIIAALGESESSSYTIPADKTAVITSINVTVDATEPCDVVMWQRQGADTIAAPFSPKRKIMDLPQLGGHATIGMGSYISLPEKTDIWFTATSGTGSGSSVSVAYDLIIV